MIKYSIFKTNMGWIGVLVNQRGVLRTTLPMGTRLNVKELIYILTDAIQNLI